MSLFDFGCPLLWQGAGTLKGIAVALVPPSIVPVQVHWSFAVPCHQFLPLNGWECVEAVVAL